MCRQRHPELYAAHVGTGQMVSVRETDRIIYDDTLAWARASGNTGPADTLAKRGPPPYERILDYEPALSYLNDVYPYDHSPNAEGEGQFSENLFEREYTLVEQIRSLAGVLDSFNLLYPQLQDTDFRADATRVDVRVHLAQGGTKYEAEPTSRRSGSRSSTLPTRRWSCSTRPGTAPVRTARPLLGPS